MRTPATYGTPGRHCGRSPAPPAADGPSAAPTADPAGRPYAGSRSGRRGHPPTVRRPEPVRPATRTASDAGRPSVRAGPDRRTVPGRPVPAGPVPGRPTRRTRTRPTVPADADPADAVPGRAAPDATPGPAPRPADRRPARPTRRAADVAPARPTATADRSPARHAGPARPTAAAPAAPAGPGATCRPRSASASLLGRGRARLAVPLAAGVPRRGRGRGRRRHLGDWSGPIRTSGRATRRWCRCSPAALLMTGLAWCGGPDALTLRPAGDRARGDGLAAGRRRRRVPAGT